MSGYEKYICEVNALRNDREIIKLLIGKSRKQEDHETLHKILTNINVRLWEIAPEIEALKQRAGIPTSS